MKILISTNLLFFIILKCFSQDLTQNLKGYVTDQQSGFPIIGANVVVMNSEPLLGATSDENGYFIIKDVPIGRHTVKVSSVGYEEHFIPEVLLGTGKELSLNIKLRESITSLDELVISAEKEKGAPLNEMAAVSAISFSVEETSRYAATFDDPARAALTFPGVGGGGDDILNEIVIRGNSPRGLLWRIEGVEVPNPNHFAEIGSSAGGISMLSSNMMANSDFFTGAFPAEYGNAISGVFDIYLRNGNHDKREYAFEAGLMGIQIGAEGPFAKNSRSSYLVNYRYSTLGLLEKVGINILGENESITFSDLSYKLNFPTKKAGTFTLWGLGGSSSDTELADVSFNEYFNSDFNVKMGATGLKHVYFFDKNTYIETKAIGTLSQNFYLEDSLNIIDIDKEDFNEYNLRLATTLNKKINAKNSFQFGVIGSKIGYNILSKEFDQADQNLRVYLDDDGHTYFYRSYLQWQYRPTSELTVNSGVHYSFLALNNQQVLEPRLGMKWQFSPKQSLNAGFGVHSRMESVAVYLSKAYLEDGSFIYPNKNLDFTKARHFVMGYENRIKPDLKFRAEAYYQDLYSVPVRPAGVSSERDLSFSALNENDGYTTNSLVNKGSGQNYGIEFSLDKYFTNNYYLIANLSVYQSKYVPVDGIKRNTRYNEGHIFNLIFGKEIKVGKSGENLIGLNTKFIWSGGLRVPPILKTESIDMNHSEYDWSRAYSQQLPDYWRIDLGIKYTRNLPNYAWSLVLNIQNVTNRINYSWQYYSQTFEKIVYEEQLGMLPNLSFKVEF